MTLAQRLYLLLADTVLLLHAGFVAFVVVGLVLVWLGRIRGWNWVRNFWFRMSHLVAIGVVAAQSLEGCICPLTTWENWLRLMAGGEKRYEGSFLQHWLHRLLFFDLDDWVFTVAYLGFFLAVALSFWLVPPRGPFGKCNCFNPRTSVRSRATTPGHTVPGD